jgi:hypothetical protein
MDAMRAERVQRMHDAEIPPAQKQGRPKKGSTPTFSEAAGRGAEYAIARLKRDRPDLAKRVVAGELSVYAAARQAGIRKPVVTVTSPESIARALRKHLDADDIAAGMVGRVSRLRWVERVVPGRFPLARCGRRPCRGGA